MDDYSQEIQKKLDALPSHIRQYVYSANMSKEIQEIGTQFKLHIDQIGQLETEAAAVMIGVTKPEEFTQNIADALTLDETVATQIVNQVNERVFKKIQGTMRQETPSTQTSTTLPVTQSNPPQQQKPPLIIPSTPPITPTITLPPAQKLEKPLISDENEQKPVDIHAETILTQPTASIAPAPKPQEKPIVKVDPYREPVE